MARVAVREKQAHAGPCSTWLREKQATRGRAVIGSDAQHAAAHTQPAHTLPALPVAALPRASPAADYWGWFKPARAYHHTGPVSTFYALREALAIVGDEGLAAMWDRHLAVSGRACGLRSG